MRANNLTSLNRVKTLLSLPVAFSTEDNLLVQLIDSASFFISKTTKRNLKYGSYVEYNDGGRSSIILNNYPIVTLTSVHEDANREYASSSLLTVSEDYEVHDKDAGILRSLNGKFDKSKSILKIVYTGGISSYWFDTGLAFKDVSDGVAKTAVLYGEYNAETLPDAIKAAMEAVSTKLYTVSFAATTHRFTIATSNGTYLDLLYSTTSNSYEELGFASAKTGALSYTSDMPALGVTPDIKEMAEELVLLRYKYFSKDRIGIMSESRGEQSFSYDFRTLPPLLASRIDSFKDWRVIQDA